MRSNHMGALPDGRRAMGRARFGATVWLWVWLGLTGCDASTQPGAETLGRAPAGDLAQSGAFAADGVQRSALVVPGVGWRRGLREAAEVLARVGALSTDGAGGGAEADRQRRMAPELVVGLPEHPANGLERFGRRPPADDIETGVGPVGFGPCADCVQLFVKRDDVLPGVTDLREVGKVEVQILTVDGRSTRLEVLAPPGELAWHPADGPLLRIDLPFDQLKRFVVWQVGGVRAEVEVTAGGSEQWVSFEAGVRRTEVYVGSAEWVAPEVGVGRVEGWVPYAQGR